jgi:small multidrug resistance pump
VKWLLLAGAIGFEVFGTTALKVSDGLTRFWWATGTALGYVISFVFLAFALKSLDVGTAYAIWSGAGTAAIALIGVAVFNENFGWVKVLGVALIVAGVVAINLGGSTAH